MIVLNQLLYYSKEPNLGNWCCFTAKLSFWCSNFDKKGPLKFTFLFKCLLSPLEKKNSEKRSTKKENGKLHNEHFLMWLGRSRLYVLWLFSLCYLFLCTIFARLSAGYRPDWRLISTATIDAHNRVHYWWVDPHKLGIMNFATWTRIVNDFLPM